MTGQASGHRYQRQEQSSPNVGTPDMCIVSWLLPFGLAALVAIVAVSPGSAETLSGALARAYGANPQLNAQRAQVRVVDETVPQALSGYRPRAQLQADGGAQFQRERSRERRSAISGVDGEEELTAQIKRTQRQSTLPRGAELSFEQNLFDGGRTRNSVSQAEVQVLAARETLRNSEQNVLLDAATAYMDVLRDQAVLISTES